MRLYDILEQDKEPEDNRSAEEIIADMRAKLAAMGKDDEEPETI